ncbi:unknown protein [Nostoc sp. NIES-3756]|uniref:hypothetical protein n=1 Tax=Nostoc sp. NIES-3756 TaxID=1751286 RepID=UPI00071F1664|nr:hypothetical protein [Nostoc sp. NIES-3756]BAT51623.1 unknown protein [Nostoc sp. NIES-3756]BAY40661.1 hypothetical protein NIES2111_50480 [Nostoc sp. NIES-2111]
MTNESTNNANQPVGQAIDSSDRVQGDHYDRIIVPAETAARKEREGDLFKTKPTEEREADAATDDQTDAQSIRTTDGYTVDKEGLLNNYAVEPEMYYEVPGDAKKAKEQETASRVQELVDVNEDKQGELTERGDVRGKGPGLV